MTKLDDVLVWLEAYGVTGERIGDEFKCRCPFHEDDKPSCSVNLVKQTFHCFGCNAAGDAVSFLAGVSKLSRSDVLKQIGQYKDSSLGHRLISLKSIHNWHQDLLASKQYLGALRAKGLEPATAKKFLLGLKDDRVTIPIFNELEDCVNVRLWSPIDRKRKVINVKRHGQARLYPVSALKSTKVYITEGELKALLLNQLGFPAVCGTGGASTWKPEWCHSFKGKEVWVVYDIDPAGRDGAAMVCQALHGIAAQVFDVQLPISSKEFPHGDITDFVVILNHGASDLQAVFDATPAWVPLDSKGSEDLTVYDVHLVDASKSEFCGKRLQSEAIVSAKDIAPYLVPRAYEVRCPRDRDYCAICPVYHGKDQTFKIDPPHQSILEMVNVPRDMLDIALKRATGIPKVCNVCRFKVTESLSVEEVRLIPQLGIQTDQRQSAQTVVQAFHCGHGIETNVPYLIKARSTPMPSSQRASLLIYEAKPSQDNLSSFEVTPELVEQLKTFQPASWSTVHLDQKLDDLYEDLEINVTRIYNRRNLHLMYDLAYHSCLTLNFQGKAVKGWVEVLVIGDSGQGKSETVNALLQHYNCGEKIDCKGASAVGLIGGLQESAGGKRWFVSWGVITLQDRRLVVLEEVKGMPTDVIARLTEVRSSGIATVSKIEKARTSARTRLIWISNPRSERQILTYSFGVEAIKELMGSLEDIRRLDAAMVVASGEVNREVINVLAKDRPKRAHVYTSELCHRLVLWAWSRLPDQIQFEPGAEELILQRSNEMSEAYSSRIPLVEPADQRLKLARLATALAARTFSTNDGHILIVRRAHVERVYKFLTHVYGSYACSYAKYSEILKSEQELPDEQEILAALTSIPFAADTVKGLLESQSITLQSIIDWTGLDRDQAQLVIGLLVRKNAVRRTRFAYVKSPAFIKLLRKLSSQELPNSALPANLEY